MPIYAYRCETCGFTKDHLQKLSDAALSICPECGQATYRKQVTAAGFQLKGSGWYVTDFKGGNKAPATATKGSESKENPAAGDTASSPSAANSTASEKSGTSTSPDSASTSAKGTPAANGKE
ncbi:FmdB family zinc ribbon protein [Accumulibacter sp.]|uniref:FmdB family zinc ribbon protein n=1 Tax=Accumulibacter sp. TaxID=2053492 RepID=UPI0035AFA0AC